jgi:hypothetical protein
MTLGQSTRTFGQLSKAVQRGFGDESGVQLEEPDILAFANDGLMEIVAENAILKARSTANSVINQREYTFPDAKISRVEFIHYAGRLLPNVPFADAQEKLIAYDPAQQQVGTPQWWYSYGETFWLWPAPDEVASVELFFVRYPDVLTGDSGQLLGVPDKWFNPLLDYMLKRAYEMDQDWPAAQAKESQFRAALNSQAEEESQSQFGTFPVIREV